MAAEAADALAAEANPSMTTTVAAGTYRNHERSVLKINHCGRRERCCLTVADGGAAVTQ